MPTTDCASDNGLADFQGEAPQSEAAEQASTGASKPLKSLFIGFAVTVTIGLALATWYVGVRIVAADESVPSSTAPAAPLQSAATVQPVAPVKSVAPLQSATAVQNVPPVQNPAPVQNIAPVQNVAPPPNPSAPSPSPAESSLPAATWYTVPTPAKLYLQAAGLGLKQDAGFVRSLQAKGFHAHVRTADRADNALILIGPFSSRAQMEQARRKLQSAGVLAVEAAR